MDASSLTRAFAKAADGSQREAVINAGGNIIINALRQSHPTLIEAERELDDIVERMKAALRERHYDANGQRRVTHIVIPSLSELLH